MPEVRETLLPGVGVRHEFTTASGERVAVLTHRGGRRGWRCTNATTWTCARPSST